MFFLACDIHHISFGRDKVCGRCLSLLWKVWLSFRISIFSFGTFIILHSRLKGSKPKKNSLGLRLVPFFVKLPHKSPQKNFKIGQQALSEIFAFLFFASPKACQLEVRAKRALDF